MSEDNPIDETAQKTELPADVQRMKLERKIAAEICAALFVLYGIAYFFQPEPEKQWKSFPTAGETEGEGEHMEEIPSSIHVIGPAPL